MLEEFKSDDGSLKKRELETELQSLKAENEGFGTRLKEKERNASEVARKNSLYLQQINEMEVASEGLNKRLNEVSSKLVEVEAVRDEALRAKGESDKRVVELQN